MLHDLLASSHGDPVNTGGKKVLELIENKMTYLIKSFKYLKYKIQPLKVYYK